MVIEVEALLPVGRSVWIPTGALCSCSHGKGTWDRAGHGVGWRWQRRDQPGVLPPLPGWITGGWRHEQLPAWPRCP